MRLTVFTPTYNRKELLKRAYNSLIRQTCKDFKWLIVDDGSTDGTGDEVKEWIRDAQIPIEYSYRENGGKMRAHNTGVKLCDTPLFMCLDSDDHLTDDAVQSLLDAYTGAKEKETKEKKIGGVVAHKGCTDEKLLGSSQFPETETSTLYGLYLSGFSGETTLMYETQLLRRFPFPEIEGEKYVPEDYIYDKIDEICVLSVLPKIVTVCEITDSGYTEAARKLKADNPCAFYLYYEQRAYITPPGITKLKYLARWVIYEKRATKVEKPRRRISAFWRLCGKVCAPVLLLTFKE